MERAHGLKSIWFKIWPKDRGKRYWFLVSLISYVMSLIILFVLSLESLPLHRYLPKSGLIVGAFFPFVAFAYYHRHYVKIPGVENQTHNVLSWILPALLTQLIIIFGFIILLGYPQPDPQQPNKENKVHYNRSFFSGALHYGQLFKEFQKVERDISSKRNFDKIDISNLVNYYHPLLGTGGAELCPSKDETDKYAAFCVQKFAMISDAINTIPFKLAITFGFLGALIFSLGDLVIRFNMVDLYQKNFVFYSIRFVVAASLCTTLANFFMEELPLVLAIPAFFLIGYFPERAINYMDQKMNEYLGFKTYKPIPLSLVQGISAEKALRLREIGIEDVQHLAVANVQEMKSNLPYSQDMLCDWVAQSLLILYFSKQIDSLRDAGVRTILDLEECLLASPESEVMQCAQNVGISEVQLRNIKRILATGSMHAKMDELKNCLEKEGCELKDLER